MQLRRTGAEAITALTTTAAASSEPFLLRPAFIVLRPILKASPGPLLEHVLCDGQRRKGIWPAYIEREMRDRFRDFGLCQAVVHPDIQVTSQLSDLAGRKQRADRDEAAVARRKAGT